MPIAPGTRIGRYQVRSSLGAGGMGDVYLADDAALDRQVAIKVLSAKNSGDAHAIRRLIREAKAAATLDHANICAIYEVGEADGHHFIVMQRVEGETLAARMARQPLDLTASLAIASQTADALAAAHARGIVHRDIKPQNIMITPRGQAKLMDFGLATRAIDPSRVNGDEETESGLTTPGAIIGTVKYMSPEQVQGQPVDARSDIFSFGVVLYEMVSGHHPFAAENRAATIAAILTRPPEPVACVAPQTPAELDRIVMKAIAPEKDERYQSIKELLIDLQHVGKASTSSVVSTASTRPAVRTTRLRAALLAGTVVVALVAGGLLLWPRLFATRPIASPNGKPSVAVMYFQNNTGNAQLNWLRTGLTEMLVTDLSQSPDVEVLGTDRLYQILATLKRQDDPVVSFDTVQEIARRAGVNHVVIGNYMKAGETIRISITLQEAATGRIVSSEKVEALSESDLFATVDDLIRRIKTTFAVSAGHAASTGLIAPPGQAAPLEFFRDSTEVTTPSIDAYRFYVQGLDLQRRAAQAEAVPLFEKAIAIDKDFALALVKLAVIHKNFGRSEQSDQYARRAMALTSRLLPRERYFIEGFYYWQKEETMQQALNTYRSWVEHYPNDEMAQHMLAVVNSEIERSDEAIRLGEELRQRGVSYALSWGNLVEYYEHVGQFEAAKGVLDDWLRRNPDNALGRWHLGWLLTFAWGKFDEGLAEYAKADAIDGGHRPIFGWWTAVLQDKWTAADASARTIAQGTDSNAKCDGNILLAIGEMYRGRMASALRLLDVAATSQGPRGSSQTAHARHHASAILLAQGNNAKALAQAQRASAEAGGTFELWESLYDTALAQSRLGQGPESARTIESLTAKANAFPGDREKRRAHRLAGVVALDRHDTTRAIDELRRAEDMMLARGNGVSLRLIHTSVPIWFDLGTAFIAAGHDAEAAARFQRVVNSTERREYPLQFVRSLYYLGQIAERRGDREQARAYYQRFVGYWGDGDIDRAQVADAKRKVSMN
jgi:TolB-like protein/tetratricopeptide (TPR) repeat protein